MGLKSFFKNNEETTDTHKDRELRTRYYDVNYRQFAEFIHTIAPKNEWTILSENENYGEIMVEGAKYTFIFTFLRNKPRNNGIDVKITLRTVFGFNRPKKRIVEFYQVLGKYHTYKGINM